MFSESENADVLEVIDSVPDDEFPQVFVNKLVPILEYSKKELLDFLKLKSIETLKELRTLVFLELVTVLPQYNGRDMYARRSKDNLAHRHICT